MGLTIKVKRGFTLSKGDKDMKKTFGEGDECVIWPNPKFSQRCNIINNRYPGQTMLLDYSWLQFFEGIEYPSMDELEHMVYADEVETVSGEIVEPDGRDAEGWPSWLLALGII